MKLYSPIITNNEIYLECELQRVKAGTISNCKKIMDDNNFPLALLSFVIDGIKSFKTKDGNIIEERIQIKSITSRMRQKCLESIAIDIMLLLDKDDGVSGIYHCPVCRQKKESLRKEDYDSRDFISQLPVFYNDSLENEFTIFLDYPVEIKDKNDEILLSYSSLTFRYAVINDLIVNEQQYNEDGYKTQYGIYKDCLKKIDSKEITLQIKNQYGMKLIEELDTIDLNKISKEMNKGGRSFFVEKKCQCGNIWKQPINISNFFDLGLHQEE